MAFSNSFAGMKNFHACKCKYGLFLVKLGNLFEFVGDILQLGVGFVGVWFEFGFI